eukprot:8438593-Pyramimonas_sp.AAC.1
MAQNGTSADRVRHICGTRHIELLGCASLCLGAEGVYIAATKMCAGYVDYVNTFCARWKRTRAAQYDEFLLRDGRPRLAH